MRIPKRAGLSGGAKRTRRRLQIAVRDGWVCQLCGEPVEQWLQPPHPMSRTVDHIIRLADGGTWALANLQLAHRICNQQRHNGPNAR